MANYANQKTITLEKTTIDLIHSNRKENANELFLYSTSWKYIQNAKKILSEAGFTVWLYFLKWSGFKEGENIKTKDFSPVQVKEEFGISENGARNGFQNLVDKGCLIKIEGKANSYKFTPIPTKDVVP